MPRPVRDPRSIRPGLLAFAVIFLAAALAGAGSVVTSTGPFASSASAIEDDRGGRRVVLEAAGDDDDAWGATRPVEDPGAQGSAREAWASVSSDEPPREPLPPLVEAIVDPQMHRFHAEYSDSSPPPFTPIGRRARVLSAQGVELSAVDRCELRVLPVPDSAHNCLVRVMCGDRVLYPNRAQTAGYVSCELGEGGLTQAADVLPSGTDGDPAVSFDLTRGTVSVRDADQEGRTLYDVTLQLDPAAMRVM